MGTQSPVAYTQNVIFHPKMVFLILTVTIGCNIVFILMLLRASRWFKLKKEDYWFYMINLNLVAILMFLNEYFEIATDYPFALKLLVSFAFAFTFLELFRKPIVRRIRTILNRFRK